MSIVGHRVLCIICKVDSKPMHSGVLISLIKSVLACSKYSGIVLSSSVPHQPDHFIWLQILVFIFFYGDLEFISEASLNKNVFNLLDLNQVHWNVSFGCVEVVFNKSVLDRSGI